MNHLTSVLVACPQLLAILDKMDQEMCLPTIDIDACMSMLVDNLAYQNNVTVKYTAYAINQLFCDQNLPKEAFSEHPGLFEWVYNGLEQGMQDLYHSLMDLRCYRDNELLYVYKERRGKSSVLLKPRCV